MIRRIVNKYGLEIVIGDKLQIKSDRLSGKLLANVSEGEIIVVTGFSEDGKILYHHNSLALPVDVDLYKKFRNE